MTPSRLATLGAAGLIAVLVLPGCTNARDDDTPQGNQRAAGPTSASIPATAATPSPGAPSSTRAAAPVALDLGVLESRFDARVGVVAVDTGTGRTLTWRGDERFAFASTIKAPLAAVVLDRTSDAELDTRVTYTQADLVPYSPVTEHRVDSGMSLRELGAAAVRYSDNTAANLLLAEVGGPPGLEAALAEYGDNVTRVDRIEPDLNTAVPGDPRDTSTPAAMAATLRAVAVDDALEPDDRAQLLVWLRGNTTGNDVIRAGTPAGWEVGDKTGSGGFGTRNDIAVLWPPGGAAPVVLAVMSSREAEDAEPDDELLAEATRQTLAALD